MRIGLLNKEQSRGFKFPFESKSRKIRSVSKAKKKTETKCGFFCFRGDNISTLSLFILVFLHFLSFGEGEDYEGGKMCEIACVMVRAIA